MRKSFRHSLVKNMSVQKCNEVKVQVFDQKSTSLQVKSAHKKYSVTSKSTENCT